MVVVSVEADGGIVVIDGDVAAIAIGYAAQVPAGTQDPLGQRDLAPRSRKKIGEFVVSSWGQPAKLS